MTKRIVFTLLFLGLIVRGWYFLYPLGRSAEVSVDEAVYGVQAINILKGGRPVFYPAQDYTGSFSAYLAAFLFIFGGASSFLLKLVPFAASLGTIVLNFVLAKRILGEKAALWVLFLSALGTPFWNNWSSRAGTGYVEATLVGQLIIYLTLVLIKTPEKTFLFWLWGFLGGLGFWIQPTIVYFLGPCFLFLLLNRRRQLFFRPLLFIVLGFVLGAAPLIYHNLWVQPAATTDALFKMPWGVRSSFIKLVKEGFPVILGGRTTNSLVDFQPVLTLILYAFFIFSLISFVVSFFGKTPRQGRGLILSVFLATIGIFLVSTPFNQFVIEPRYVFSLYATLPLILGDFLFRLSRHRGPAILFFVLYVTVFILGFLKAGPLSFVDGYRFSGLLEALERHRLPYVITTPALGHRLMFLSHGRVQAAVRGGGISEVRFKETNYAVTRVRDLEPRLVGYVSFLDDTLAESFRNESTGFQKKSQEEIVEGRFRLFYAVL